MSTRFVLRFERGSGAAPALKGHYIAWEGGFLRPCSAQSSATRYDHSNVAANVALRAAAAFRGARLEVLPVFQ